MTGTRKQKLGWMMAFILLAAMLLTAAGGAEGNGEEPTLRQMETESFAFTESSKLLKNPNRGFFHLHGFIITDEETDYLAEMENRFGNDTETTLAAIQINLREFKDGPISEQGLANLEKLFEALAGLDKHLILRFLYDWDGKGIETEPDTREQILEHMEQLGPLLTEYSDKIFVLQGVFVGDCGEMHGSKFLTESDIRVLAKKLAKVTDPTTYLSVRTPAHWRKTTRLSTADLVKRGSGTLASRMGLFNDGMLGNSTDCGTYGGGSLEKDGPFVNWKRAEELAFQDILCRVVPNGGEAILENPYNDLENALADMAVMHVSYLSRDYDPQVLKKWEETEILEEGCFQGMDGLAYMERHLGYRLVIRETAVDFDQETQELSISVEVQNVGFAPVYKEAQAQVILRSIKNGTRLYYPVAQDIRDLAGGTESSQLQTLGVTIPAAEIPDGDWKIYLDLTDCATGQRLLFGNEQEPARYGYLIGRAAQMEGTENGVSD